MSDISNAYTVQILEEEFEQLRGLGDFIDNNPESSCYTLAYIVIDCFIFRRKIDFHSDIYNKDKYIELMYSGDYKSLDVIGERNRYLIEFLRKNKHMIDFWKL